MNELWIKGLGAHLPRNIVDNAHLPQLDPPMSVEQMDAIGVLTRYHAGDGEDVEAMALTASQRALESAQIRADSLDFLILVNWTSRRFVPDIAPRIQHLLGARKAFAFDVCCACCGFIQALTIAQGYLQQPRIQRGLVVAADRSVDRMRPRSRATLIFGDGAAAAVVEKDARAGIRFVDYELRTDGSQHGIMEIDAEGYLLPHIRQRDLNVLAGKSMADVSNALLQRNGRSLSEIDWVVPHSGSAGVQGMLREYLGISAEKVLTTLPTQGNLTGAAIPSALRTFLDAGVIQPGHRILASAVGLGWQFGAMLLEVV